MGWDGTLARAHRDPQQARACVWSPCLTNPVRSAEVWLCFTLSSTYRAPTLCQALRQTLGGHCGQSRVSPCAV